jgi:uncharacterized protein YecE (DUF72 family)
MTKSGKVRVGIGGWTFEPWRGEFYPDKLPHAQELHYASRKLTAIEINGTFYRTQSPATFAKWRKETPDGFVFTVKGHRFVTNRKVLAEAGEGIQHFLKSGVLELGDRLGPLLWQFAPFKKFDEGDVAAFLALLPAKLEGQELRHVLEVRHDSFLVPEFVALARKHNAGIVYSEHETYPAIPDVTSDFVYARLQKGDDALKLGYPPNALDQWAERAREWAEGGAPEDLPLVEAGAASKSAKGTKAATAKPRDVFLFFIHEGKVRAPAAAMALIERLN